MFWLCNINAHPCATIPIGAVLNLTASAYWCARPAAPNLRQGCAKTTMCAPSNEVNMTARGVCGVLQEDHEDHIVPNTLLNCTPTNTHIRVKVDVVVLLFSVWCLAGLFCHACT